MADTEWYSDPDATGAGNGTSYTDAYTSVAAFDAAEETNIVTLTESWRLNCRASSGSADTSAVSIGSTWVVNATYSLTIEADVNEATGKHPGYWSTSHHRLDIASGNPIAIASVSSGIAGGLIFKGLQLNMTQAGSQHGFDSSSASFDVINCIIRKKSGSGSFNRAFSNASSNEYIRIINNLMDGFDNRAISDDSATGSYIYILNNTFVNNAVGIYISNGANRRSVLINNLFDSNTVDSTSSFSADSDYNSTSLSSIGWDPSTGGGNDKVSQSFSFAGADDYHLQSGSDGIGDGVDLSASGYYAFNYDVDGDTRSSWDVGFDEQAAAAGNTLTVNQSESGDSIAASFAVINALTVSQAESGDTIAANLDVINSISVSQAETGDTTAANIIGIQYANISASQSESGDITTSAIEVVNALSVSQAESGDTNAAAIQVINALSVSQSEAGDTTTASITGTLTSYLSVNQLETGDITVSNLQVIETITASQTEAGDATAATIISLRHLTISQAEAGDVNTSVLQVVIQITADQSETGDTQVASLVETITLLTTPTNPAIAIGADLRAIAITEDGRAVSIG